ncbi:MAG: MCE family protein [candidate division Zixibacteria bacterium]|nr:MCE family protein [candidate division Zixibacteria bacterium]
MSEKMIKEIKVGALIAFGLFVVFSTFFIIGGQEGIFSSKYELYARFNNIEGLAVGAPVRLGGMKVGTIGDIWFSGIADKKAISVKMMIKSSSFDRIRSDSKAKLGNMGLLGDRTIEISLGSFDAEPVEPGQFIVSEGGHVLEDIMDLTGNAKEITSKINEGEGSLAQIINDPRLYSNLDSLLIIWSEISSKINEGEGNLAALMNDPALYNNLTKFFKESSAFMEKVNAGEGELGKLATGKGNLYNRTDSALVALNKTLETINNGEGTLGQLIYNAELYERLSSTLTSLDSLLVDIKENPKKYVKLSLF